jgi:hypothetical protein
MRLRPPIGQFVLIGDVFAEQKPYSAACRSAVKSQSLWNSSDGWW